MKTRIRGFFLRHRITLLFRSCFRRNRLSAGYRRLEADVSPLRREAPGTMSSRLMSWGHRLKSKAKAICSGSRPGPGFGQIGRDPQGKCVEVPPPKGHLAVYVGQKDGDFERVLVPVIYFNHPLFGELLRGAEEEFGFNHPGGITLPCRISDFETVRTRIMNCRRRGSRRTLALKRTLLPW